MKKINKKGFSMVELLAVITILGILAAISIISVQRILEKAKNEYYQKQKNNLIMAAQSYVKSSKENQPKILGQLKTVTLKELKDNKYIDKVVDYSKKACDPIKTYVDIFYHDMNEDYEYTAYLKCPGYSDDQVEKLSPTIDIKYIDTLKDKKVQITMKGSSSDNKLKLYSYLYKIYKQDDSGQYVEVKRYQTSKKVNSTTKTVTEDLNSFIPGKIRIEVIAINEKGKETTAFKNKEFNQASGGPICIYKGDSSDKSINATIGKKLSFEKDKSKEITIGCKDDESGCINNTYTKKFTGDVKTGYITISNKKGIQTRCEVDVYIDNNNPKVDIEDLDPSKPPEENTKGETEYTYEHDWTNKDVCFTYSATDGSGIKSVKWELNKKGLSQCNNSKGLNDLTTVTEYTKTYSNSEIKENTKATICIKDEGYRIGKLTIKDSSGHTSIVKVTAKIDKTAPSTPTTVSMFKWSDNNKEPSSTSGLKSYSNNTWSNKKVYTKATGSTDKISCIKEYEYQTTGAEGSKTNKGNNKNITNQGTSTIKYRACDYAGNCSPYTSARTIKLDWEAPTVPKVNLYKWKDNSNKPTNSSGLSSYSSGAWSNKKIFTQPSGSTDKASGNIYYQVTTTGKTTNIKDTKVTYRNIEAEGTSTVKYRACDEAGNCSAYSQASTINIDTVKPECGSNNGPSAGNWARLYRTITVNCSDKTSGCKKSQFSRQFTSTTSTGNIEIEDNAGNKNTCKVNVYIDHTPPTCGANTGKKEWVNYNREVTVACSDKESGCSKSNFSDTFYFEGTSDNIIISDKVGNIALCEVPTYIDKTAPTCGSITNGAGTETREGQLYWKWINSNRTASVKCSDSASGCTQSSYQETFKGPLTYYGNIEIKDKAGNKTSCEIPVFIDKVPPLAPKINWYHSDEGVVVTNDTCATYNGSREHNYSCSYTRSVGGNLTTNYNQSDQGSGIKETQMKLSCPGISDADYVGDWIPIRDSFLGTGPGSCVEIWRSVDYAGNAGAELRINITAK